MKCYIKADIADLLEEDLSTLIAMAQDPTIGPRQADQLANHKDPILRFNLLENPNITKEQKHEFRLRENGRWVNFAVWDDRLTFDCRIDTDNYDEDKVIEAIERFVSAEGAMCNNVYVSRMDWNPTRSDVFISVYITCVSGFEDTIWCGIQHLLEDQLDYTVYGE